MNKRSLHADCKWKILAWKAVVVTMLGESAAHTPIGTHWHLCPMGLHMPFYLLMTSCHQQSQMCMQPCTSAALREYVSASSRAAHGFPYSPVLNAACTDVAIKGVRGEGQVLCITLKGIKTRTRKERYRPLLGHVKICGDVDGIDDSVGCDVGRYEQECRRGAGGSGMCVRVLPT